MTITHHPEYQSTTEHAAQIRKAYRAAGIKASVRSDSYSMGSAIRIVVKAGSVAKAREIAMEHESVRRCEISGEILSGGNRHVDVTASSELVASFAVQIRGAVIAALASIDGNAIERVAGTAYGMSWDRDYRRGMVWKFDATGGTPGLYFFDADGATYAIARGMAE